jgi:hypothetical protein
MYYLIYKITNQINGKIYIGSHKTKNLNDGYMGSGKHLKYAQQKYGIENFKREILYVLNSAEEMYAKEAEIVTEDFISEKYNYNIKIGGLGGWDHVNNDVKFRIAKNKNAMKVTNTKHKDKLSEWASLGGKKTYELHGMHPNFLKTMGMGFKNKKHTDTTKSIIGQKNSIHQSAEGNSQFGTMWITNGIENKKIKKDCLIPEGWYKGRKINKST